MKKFPKILSVLLVAVMVVTMIPVPANAAFLVFDDFVTPYGQVHCDVQLQNTTPWEPDPLIGFSAGTSINSNMTMVWTYTALQIQAQSTGRVLLNDARYTYDSNVSSAGGYLRNSEISYPCVAFSTHSVLYTTSYAKYYTSTF